ncbi:TPA: leucine--tRNA ligase [Candidatus Bathyarchaeota archaeon]|nr:leucine--tRNA ligase [Candidatus Bathyarchaeota archaeon]
MQSSGESKNLNSLGPDSTVFMSQTKQTEEKWLRYWEAAHLFEADPDPERKKLLVTFPYPYMNGPLHVGHAFTATRVDVYARFKRMQGYNVLWPWSWHWTGQPLLAASNRVKKGDEIYIRLLREVDGVPEAELKKFADPLYMAQYYTNEGRAAARAIGFSIDWRREFTTVMPTYQKFIEWQYTNLREQGYVSKGTHPVVWCPKDKSPTGDHDRQIGEGVTPEEYILIKYQLDERTFLPAATFRPETIYGVTNMWINPDATYVEAAVDQENWIISQEAAEKLREQEKKVEIKRALKGRELIGKTFTNPITKAKFPILPGWFVDPKQATGVVYSVPAHAPYDWLALKDLQGKPDISAEFGIDPKIVQQITPVSLITLEGYGRFPAVEIVQQMGVKDQHDPKAEEATKELYKKEFHGGILNESCGPYSGKTVRDIKDVLIRDFKSAGVADSMYDLPQSVVCRCMTPCVVKVLSDQWFLNYSNDEWKAKAKEAVAGMKVFPQTASSWFIAVIDWLKEWACARTTGFGTPLPWGKGWIIETLSDSTVYMAFYTINKHIRQHGIKPEALTREVFDYIFLGKGDPPAISENAGLHLDKLNGMREEFLYWYPFDLRVSAKELVPNHLTFCIFHHVALFPRNLWPRAIGVNGMLLIEGKQMHKSKGNFITMKGAVERYGADATRCALLLGAEEMDDPDWRSDNALDLKSKLESWRKFAHDICSSAKNEKVGHLEKWLLSRLQKRITTVSESLEELKTRTALQVAFFETWNDFRWYIQRNGKADAVALREASQIWIRLLAPFAPFTCEELWNSIGAKGFVSLAKWPKTEEQMIDLAAEENEALLTDLIDDTLNVVRATKITPRHIFYYTAASWKHRVYKIVLDKAKAGEILMGEIMKTVSADPELKPHMKDAAALIPRLIKTLNKIPQERKRSIIRTEGINENRVFTEALSFLRERFNSEITVFSEEDKEKFDPKKRAQLAIPAQPAIYIE